jgi:hypothetical protein
MTLRANRPIALLIALPLLLLLAAPSAQATVPGAPINVSAVDSIDASGHAGALISWSVNPNGGLPQHFKIYMGADPSTSRKIAVVPMQSPDSGLTWIQDYSYYVANLDSGTWSFYIIAVNADGASQPSAVVNVTLHHGSGGGIRWMSSPPPAGLIGVPYVYDADAASSTQEAAAYLGVSLPGGASIDSATGLLTYTANTAGKQNFIIKAYLPSDPTVSALQTWHVYFTDSTANPGHCGFVRGTVYDQDNAPVDAGTVKVTNISDPTGPSYAGTIAQGTFFVGVPDSGLYIVKILGTGCVAEWYQDAADAASATPILVHCGDTATIAATVQKLAHKTISGHVYAAADSTALSAKVVAQDENGTLYYAVTDASGAYALSVPVPHTYIVWSFELNRLYQPQYYDQVADPALATAIALTDDRGGVDFYLTQWHHFSNGIEGTVKNAGSAGVPSKIFAYYFPPNSQAPDMRWARYTITDSMGIGHFVLVSVLPGDYVLFVHPLDTAYVAGYYKSGAEAVPDWQSATRITVADQGIVSGCDILLHKRFGLLGTGVVYGVVQSATHGLLPALQPLPNSLVLLRDPSGAVSEYAVTDAVGAYQFNRAPQGTLTIAVDRVGYQPYATQIQMSEVSIMQAGASLQPVAVTAVDAPAALPELPMLLAPNPARAQILVSLTGAGGDAVLRVFDAAGREVLSRAWNGSSALRVDVSALAPGAYHAVATSGRRVATRGFSVVR